jgi:hypothetical protein
MFQGVWRRQIHDGSLYVPVLFEGKLSRRISRQLSSYIGFISTFCGLEKTIARCPIREWLNTGDRIKSNFT